MIRDLHFVRVQSTGRPQLARMTWIRLLLLILALIVSNYIFCSGVLVQSAPPQTQDTPAIRLGPCAHPGIYPDARCGILNVFENRSARTGRQISLNVAVLPALGSDSKPDPVFILVGGPGQGAADVYLAGARKDQVASIRAHREVVLVDQRGTGGSHALPCVLYPREAGMQAIFGDLFPADIVRACRDSLSKDADLTQYTTSIAMDDLDDVRAALGYDRINVQGGSYGTRAALVYMRQHPEHVRAVVLEGVAPTDYKLPLPVARAVDHALDRLIEDCVA
ncbi:MAG TPA: alpha/beta fold hydrolase, partial [Candidatus Limnocylindrales bacterium]|nr:alpha/beta fold hydrolase [Candidatus Limnocylindrales bacterium]